MYRKTILTILLVIFALSVSGAWAQEGQALLRFAHLALDVEAVDVYVDGELELSDVRFFTLSEHLRLPPGPMTVTITRAGRSPDRPLVDPVTFDANSPYSYIVALVGMLSDESLTAISIDETTAFRSANLNDFEERTIILNGLAGAPELDVYIGRERVAEQLALGEYAAINFPLVMTSATFVETGRFGRSVYEMSDTYGLPNNTSLVALVGDYAGQTYGTFVTNYSPLDLVEFLRGWREHGVVRFDTFVEGLESAGLAETLSGSGPFTVFAPPDSVFEQMPQSELDDLLRNSRRLGSVWRYHIVPEKLMLDDILAREDDGVVTLTTLDGLLLTIRIDRVEGQLRQLLINDSVQITSVDFEARNGIVHMVDGLLSMSALPGNTVSLPVLGQF